MSQPQVSITLSGLEDLIERIVDEKLRVTLAEQSGGWLTSDEAAEYLGIARSTLHDLVCDERLPRHGEGHRLMFRRSELDAYLDLRGRT